MEPSKHSPGIKKKKNNQTLPLDGKALIKSGQIEICDKWGRLKNTPPWVSAFYKAPVSLCDLNV